MQDVVDLLDGQFELIKRERLEGDLIKNMNTYFIGSVLTPVSAGWYIKYSTMYLHYVRI